MNLTHTESKALNRTIRELGEEAPITDLVDRLTELLQGDDDSDEGFTRAAKRADRIISEMV